VSSDKGSREWIRLKEGSVSMGVRTVDCSGVRDRCENHEYRIRSLEKCAVTQYSILYDISGGKTSASDKELGSTCDSHPPALLKH
jgi:hypothetical protein